MALKIYEPDTSPETFSLEEAAKSLRVPIATLINMIGDWVIETRCIDNEYRIDKNILQGEKYVVTITADLTTTDKIIWAKINAKGDGLYLRKDNQLDKDTDIYVTTLGRRTLAELKKRFRGRVVYLVVDKKDEEIKEGGEDKKIKGVIIPDGHSITTLDRLPWTLRAIANVIRCERSKK